MKRQKAAKLSISTKLIAKDILVSYDLLEKISLEKKFNIEELKKIAEIILTKKGFSQPKNCFAVVQKIQQLNTGLSDSNIIFIIIKLYVNTHWTIICKENDRVILINPFKDAPIDEIQSVLESKSITLSVMELTSSEINIDDGLMALAHLHMMNEKFQLEKIAQKSEIKQIITKILNEHVSAKLFHDLETNEEFKRELRNFLIQINVEFKIQSKLAMNYIQLLKENSDMLENDETCANEKIKKAREDFMNNESTKALISESTVNENSQDDCENITKKDSNEMLNFKTFSQLLYHTKNTEKVNDILQKISKKLEIDNQLLKAFFEQKPVEEAQTTLTSEKSSIPIENIPIKPIKDEKCDENVQSKGRIPSTLNSNSEYFRGSENEKAKLSILDKDIDEILNELKTEHGVETNDEAIKDGLKSQFSSINSYAQQWKDKTKEDIRKWSNLKKGNLQKNDICEAIAVLNHANSLITGWFSLRNTQILAILMLHQGKDNHGIFYEILTGEGKTVTISMLAVLKILIGEKSVDIVTPNSILAREGMEDRINFYAIFDISVDVNNFEEMKNFRGERECYKADIVYGTMVNFQGDYLRHEFENLKTRGNRGFGCLILDEVDSLLLDSGGHITKLAIPFIGMDALKYIYIKIWYELLKVDASLVNDIEETIKHKNEELITANKSEESISNELQEFKQNLIKNAQKIISNKIKQTSPTQIHLIPSHLQNFCDHMLDKWIQNAIYAKYSCYENVHYVIRKDEDNEDVIVPVDYINTGVTLKNTVWCDGLHQFIQLKHNLNVTTETLTSSFISNIGYVELYKNNLIGLTGTLGSHAEYKLLSEVYKLNYVRVSPFKPKQFTKLPGRIIDDNKWVDCIALEAIKEAKKKRSVLIICMTIFDVSRFEKSIKFLQKIDHSNGLIVKIFSEEENSKILDEEIGISEIIIATNIAGRGADFKTTDELEMYGGLHVCVTFLPANQRIQDQAFGRTSRQGRKGTAQIIAKASDISRFGGAFVNEYNNDVEFIRNNIEKQRLQNIRMKEIPKIKFMDEIFNKFLMFFKNERNNEYYTKPYLKDVKEYWAFWLKEKNYQDVKDLDIESEFNEFCKQVQPILRHKNYRNPYHYIEEAEISIDNNKLDEAKNTLNKAIEKSNFLYSAHIKLFEISIQNGKALQKRLKKLIGKMLLYGYFINETHDYLNDARKSLENAINIMKIEINHIESEFQNENFSNLLSAGIVHNSKSIETANPSEIPLVKHINSRLTILKSFYAHYDSLHKQLDKMNNAVIKCRIPNYFENFQPESESEKKMQKFMLDDELNELSMLGLNVVYALQEIHDTHNAVIKTAQAQILGGIAALAKGILFPPSLPIMAPIASILISEGICDIIIELLTVMESEFNLKNMIKSKIISYSLSILTLGISKLVQCQYIVDKAIKVIQSTIRLLRRCPVLKNVCEIIAISLERFLLFINITSPIAKAIGYHAVNIYVHAVFDDRFRNFENSLNTELINKRVKDVLEEFKSYCSGLAKQLDSKITSDVSTVFNTDRLEISKIIDECADNLNYFLSWNLNLTVNAINFSKHYKLGENITKFFNLFKTKSKTEDDTKNDEFSDDHKIKLIVENFIIRVESEINSRIKTNFHVFRDKKNLGNINLVKKQDYVSIEEIVEAFELLELDPCSNKNEIEKQLENLTSEDHYKKDVKHMIKLSEAGDLAKKFISDKDAFLNQEI